MNEQIRSVQAAMERWGYIAEPEIAKVLARMLSTELVRLQCYEGLDSNTALYEWNYQRQLLRLKIAERESADPGKLEELIFGREYLLERPLLRAITRREGPAVLLIDEIDRADDGFEAFLLELLSDFQITIPELGTIRAEHVPVVVLTSNRSREIGDALRRRCLYLYVEHPGFDKELRILRGKVPAVSEQLATTVTRFVQKLRGQPLRKLPGVAETLDWAQALSRLQRDALDAETARATLGCLLKDEQDIKATGESRLAELLAYASARD